MEHCHSHQTFLNKYRQVKNVVVDEAQNFKDRDGDWYAIAEQLAMVGAENSFLSEFLVNKTAEDSVKAEIQRASDGGDKQSASGKGSSELDRKAACAKADDGDQDQKLSATAKQGKTEEGSLTDSKTQDCGDGSSHLNSPSATGTGSSSAQNKKPRFCRTDLSGGYFWVFMDYAQKVHKFRAGLPGLIGKNNFMLSEISRNSKEIFDYAMKFMEKPNVEAKSGKDIIKDTPVLGHTYEGGRGVEVIKCDKESAHRTLFSVLDSYLGSGLKPDDIAILVSKRREQAMLERSFSRDQSQSGQTHFHDLL
jgi:hypothetical protein